MKKYLPFVILGIGILVLAVAFFIFKGKEEVETEETAPEIPFEMRPVTSLTPTSDGHWLNMKIEKIEIEAATLDYELLYELPDGRTQGVPGTVKIQKGETIERRLLLGSESSGKFRYDEGVKQGTLTLRFRNEKGKLAGKLTAKFHLQTESDELTSIDNQFKFIFDEVPKKEFFVVMETFGIYESLETGVSKGPYGVFGSSEELISGKVELPGDIYLWTNKWEKLENGETDNIGIFASSNPQ
jgi:hypothetical protein